MRLSHRIKIVAISKSNLNHKGREMRVLKVSNKDPKQN